MDNPYRNITISGKIAVGTTTLSKSLHKVLGWEHINTGQLQREYDRDHNISENLQGAEARPDERERAMEARAHEMLEHKNNIIYEGWLSGFIARDIKDVLKVLVICSNDAVRIDRVMNRENIDLKIAKEFLKRRESENIAKWKRIYGNQNFWDPKHYDLVIDTYSSGPHETVGKVLDKICYKGER